MLHFTADPYTCIFYDALGFAALPRPDCISCATSCHHVHTQRRDEQYSRTPHARHRGPIKASADGDLGDETEAELQIHMDMKMHSMHTQLCARQGQWSRIGTDTVRSKGQVQGDFIDDFEREAGRETESGC